MKRYYIEDVKCGVSEGGLACGPYPGNVVTSIRYKENNKSKWLSIVEYDGIPNVYLFDEDVHEHLLQDEYDDEFIDYIGEHHIDEFNGIQFEGDYSNVFESFNEDPENHAIPLVRLLIALVRCSLDDVNGLIKMAKDKYADEIEAPVCDVEEEYLVELEEED